jgi:hypothetical protein
VVANAVVAATGVSEAVSEPPQEARTVRLATAASAENFMGLIL